MRNVAFDGSGLDRAARLRSDPAALAGLLARGTVLPLWRGAPACRAGQLGWLAGNDPLAIAGPRLFLGIDNGQPRFAASLAEPVPGLDFPDLRALMRDLSPREAELAATARALAEWHRSHGHCAACGAPSDPVEGGWQRLCPACGARHFPRTDPVVIMLVTRGNRALFGRSPGWPPRLLSCLAGFVEPGETVEAAVRREVQEETGIAIGRVRYLASQPWPFPASLMLGCRAEALTESITLDPAELDEAVWIDREEMARIMAGRHPRHDPPRQGAIAHALVMAWLGDRLDQGPDQPRPGSAG